MLNAQQARQMLEDNKKTSDVDISRFMRRIELNIEMATYQEKSSCNPLMFLGRISNEELEAIVSKLVQLGYTVTQNGAGITASW